MYQKLNAIAVLIAILTLCCVLTNGACICNEKGTDACQSCSGTTYVRPKPKLFEPPELNLPPIGDNCWCSKLLIEPALVPKMCSKTPPKPKPECDCSSCISGQSCREDIINYGNLLNPLSKDDSPPADPISLSLAIRAGKAIAVPEAKLAYGFVQKPVDALEKVYFSNVPEENLYKLNNEVITLKKPKPAGCQVVEDDIEDIEHEVSEEEAVLTPQLTYKQLGYVTEQFKNPKFRKLPNLGISALDFDYLDLDKFSFDCGFKPGRILPYKKLQKNINSCF